MTTPLEAKTLLDINDKAMQALSDKMLVLKRRKAELDSERNRLLVIIQNACDHPREARNYVEVNLEKEYFCTLCGKDL